MSHVYTTSIFATNTKIILIKYTQGYVEVKRIFGLFYRKVETQIVSTNYDQFAEYGRS